MDDDLTTSLFHHLCLPPQLPGGRESNLEEVNSALASEVVSALGQMKTWTENASNLDIDWDQLRRIVEISSTLQSSDLNKELLLHELQNIDLPRMLPIYIREQNAGLLIYKSNGSQIIFEAFEASVANSQVLEAKNGLIRQFPGNAATMDRAAFENLQLLEEIAGFCEKANDQMVKGFSAVAFKADSTITEVRDMARPGLVTHFLMAIIGGNGQVANPTKLVKHIHDDVTWSQGSLCPWRRSSWWLVLRVALQRYLMQEHDAEIGRVIYKALGCVVLKRLLELMSVSASAEQRMFVVAKLARRAAKLEQLQAKLRAPRGLCRKTEDLLHAVLPKIEAVLDETTEIVRSTWNAHKAKNQKRIPRLPHHAEESALILSLPNSHAYIHNVLNTVHSSSKPTLSNIDSTLLKTQDENQTFRLHYSLADLERHLKQAFSGADPSSQTVLHPSGSDLADLAVQLGSYVDSAIKAYNNDPEQISRAILLIMESWIILDAQIIRLHPPLQELAPPFASESLDVLQLMFLGDMIRLREVQLYINQRLQRCKDSQMNIFARPAKDCLADLFWTQSSESPRLQSLYSQMKAQGDQARAAKTQEWQNEKERYDKLSLKVWTEECNRVPGEDHKTWACNKCRFDTQRKNIKISLHEDPLPSAEKIYQIRAIVFELCCPEVIRAYRDVTWRIISTLSRTKTTSPGKPEILLRQYGAFAARMPSAKTSITLGSLKKAFMQTHYNAKRRFPVALSDICHSHGCEWTYFDVDTHTWTHFESPPSFAHHFGLRLTPDSPYYSLCTSSQFDATSTGFTSNEAISNSTQCPRNVSVHEWSAFQSLCTAYVLRWPNILIEMGSSNLNFGSEAVERLIVRLSLQAGPMYGRSALRETHRIFSYSSFSEQLAQQIDKRVDNLEPNWREVQSMSLLLKLTLRLRSLTKKVSEFAERTSQLLVKIRRICSSWIEALRDNVAAAETPEATKNFSLYMFRISLLLRWSFACLIEDQTLPDHGALVQFVQASLSMQNNLVSNEQILSDRLKVDLTSSLSIVRGIAQHIRDATMADPGSILEAIGLVFGDTALSSRVIDKRITFQSPLDWWIGITIRGDGQLVDQIIHYHILNGHLLINGQPFGILPRDHAQYDIVREFYGERTLSTIPSCLVGMQLQVLPAIRGHSFHIGFRSDKPFVRVSESWTGKIMEFIPSSLFVGPDIMDFPAPLIDNCVHWLEISTGLLHIREKPDVWVARPSNWTLDMGSGRAQRRQSSLVDINSPLSGIVSQIFAGFEERRHIIITQPPNSSLKVQLRRLDLRFKRSGQGSLECYELKAEIDSNQDIGTWYGLTSKLVLRDLMNVSHRQVLVPLGNPSLRREGMHVRVHIHSTGHYARFTIDTTLGRLQCPKLLTLLYLKALLHAHTSFVIPDPLTRRTGTEQALHCLKQGYCQPMGPLTDSEERLLKQIAKLAPRRIYYPPRMKQMQIVDWKCDATITIQHEELGTVIDPILRTSRRLAAFHSSYIEPIEPTESTESTESTEHLLQHRALILRTRYQRSDSGIDASGSQLPVKVYASADWSTDVERCERVNEVVDILNCRPTCLNTVRELGCVLETTSIAAGYDHAYEMASFNDHLSLDIRSSWGSLVKLCADSKIEDRYRLMFTFGLLSFCSKKNMELIRTMLSFALFDNLRAIRMPVLSPPTVFKYHQDPDPEALILLIKGCALSSNDLAVLGHNKANASQNRDHTPFEFNLDETKVLIDALVAQWPREVPSLDRLAHVSNINSADTYRCLASEWQRLWTNRRHSQYLDAVQKALDQNQCQNPHPAKLQYLRSSPCKESTGRSFVIPDLTTLIVNAACNYTEDVSLQSLRLSEPFQCNPINSEQLQSRIKDDDATRANELSRIVAELSTETSGIAARYSEDLNKSIRALQIRIQSQVPQGQHAKIGSGLETDDIEEAAARLEASVHALISAFEKACPGFRWLQRGQLSPCMDLISLLEQLRLGRQRSYGQGVGQALLHIAMAVTRLQRSKRIFDARLRGQVNIMDAEIHHVGHIGWDPAEYPEWVLLEIESDILIRQEQASVASATIDPASGKNTLVQLQMGQGKTSCILPMAAAVLADRQRLLRIILPRALLKQTAHVLQNCLGGLIGRSIYHIPYSRRTSADPKMTQEYLGLHQEALQSGGVILGNPEHLLSFELNGYQELSDEHWSNAEPLIQAQQWLAAHSRDILDESDQLLSVQTQLIYPSGTQTAVDGHPWRWEIAENILHLTRNHLWFVKRRFPDSIDLQYRSYKAFPLISFGRKDAELFLRKLLLDDFLQGRLVQFPAEECGPAELEIVSKYLGDFEVSAKTEAELRRLFPDNQAAQVSLHLMRGLLVHDVLITCLKKRYNVRYGLHPERDPIAVPFLAKGVPNPTAEWGHVDVAIILTALSFYIGGLNERQLNESFQQLLKSDDPGARYDRWIQCSADIPISLRHWNSVNLDDEVQARELLIHLKFNTVAIDDYLNSLVFPRHMRQFSTSMQNSCWDLVLKDRNFCGLSAPSVHQDTDDLPLGKIPPSPLTTGFSGTNDNRFVLPLNVQQVDLVGLAHTNAEALVYLLHQRNREYIVATDASGHCLDEIALLQLLENKNIMVLIDAGAQISERSNLDLVKEWLHVSKFSQAAAYFNAQNELYVVYRNTEKKLPLSVSPFAEDMTGCLMYYDQAHTRGVDVELPANAKAALTLSFDMTKDDAVQAAMRMRQLAVTQSISWVSPPRVHQSILDHRHKSASATLDSSDVVSWLLSQSCKSLETMQPIFHSQGVKFCYKQQALIDHRSFLTNSGERKELLSALQHTERQTLRKLYSSYRARDIKVDEMSKGSDLMHFARDLHRLKEGFSQRNFAAVVSASSEVEQQREIQQEVESVREMQRPFYFKPCSPPTKLDDALCTFLSTGILPRSGYKYEPASEFIRQTGLGRRYHVSNSRRDHRLFVTPAYSATTITRDSKDNFIRAVNWVVVNAKGKIAIIVSPEEAGLMIPLLRSHPKYPVYLLAYAAPVTQVMSHFNGLRYLSFPPMPDTWEVPSWLPIELGFFAGRLYFGFDEYEAICEFLGIPVADAERAATDISVSKSSPAGKPAISNKPLSFVQAWLDLRRKGADFTHTPMGYVAQGKVLTADHPFFQGRTLQEGCLTK